MEEEKENPNNYPHFQNNKQFISGENVEGWKDSSDIPFPNYMVLDLAVFINNREEYNSRLEMLLDAEIANCAALDTHKHWSLAKILNQNHDRDEDYEFSNPLQKVFETHSYFNLLLTQSRAMQLIKTKMGEEHQKNMDGGEVIDQS